MPGKIEHIVVLMLENRSFDHALGYLFGLDGSQSNPDNDGLSHPTTADATYLDPVMDAGHECKDVLFQLFGKYPPDPGSVPNNQGFVRNFQGRKGANPPDIMKCFAEGRRPVLHTLAREFVVCDRWFSSVPGPTWPNRLFAHAGSSDGYVVHKKKLYGMQTIYNSVWDSGRKAGIYAGDVAQSLLLRKLLFSGIFHGMGAFFDSVRQPGRLPHYVFIEPDYFGDDANDEHPPHNVGAGEHLIADVYEAIRGSSYWDKVLLIVTYDEHGGLFDHQPPPKTVNPDGKKSTSPPFDFTLLGPRVPAVLISPYLERGGVSSLVYDHTSILATTRKLFGLPHPLGKRDAQANTFDGLLRLDQPARTDPPRTLPRPTASRAFARPGQRPLSDLQEHLVQLAELVEREHQSHGIAPMRARTFATGPARSDERIAKVYVADVFAHQVMAANSPPANKQAPAKPGKKKKAPRSSKGAGGTRKPR